MIGILCKENERDIVREFFELFKTPWEFYTEGKVYDVILSTRNENPPINARLVIICGHEEKQIDSSENIRIKSQYNNILLDYDGNEIPIYGNLLTFEKAGQPLLMVKNKAEIAGVKFARPKGLMMRIGYNLFQEVLFLLTKGQPIKNAHIPTLELHITMLRNWILDAGIIVVEIPPLPEGYNFIACLTHDVDFVGIRYHKFDQTMWGFLNRSTIGSLIRVFRGRLSWKKLLKNWISALSLPGIYLGIFKDFWYEFDKYLKIESGIKSTFFLIPFKNRVGENISERHFKRRASKYDIEDIPEAVTRLLTNKHEIGVHGIDAWHSLEMACQELNRIIEFHKGSEIGIRIHWLCFNKYSYKILENAGYYYDSSFGYNDGVGYRGGTGQVFRPFGTKYLCELPLHIQDTALFFPRRMNLSEEKAFDLCNNLFQNGKLYGGVMTILWHDRSLAPERLWGDFYIKLLEKLKNDNVWFATAGQVVKWFRKRRSLNFGEVRHFEDRLKLKFKVDGIQNESDELPSLLLRIHGPRNKGSRREELIHYGGNCVDIPLKGERVLEIPL